MIQVKQPEHQHTIQLDISISHHQHHRLLNTVCNQLVQQAMLRMVSAEAAHTVIRMPHITGVTAHKRHHRPQARWAGNREILTVKTLSEDVMNVVDNVLDNVWHQRHLCNALHQQCLSIY